MTNKKMVKRINSAIFLNVIFDVDFTLKDHLGTLKKYERILET